MKYVFIIALIIFQSVNGQSQFGSLDEVANNYLDEYKVPGISICVIKPDTILYGAAGLKNCAKSDLINKESKFHIGSNAKAITANIAALLIDDGLLNWETKLIDVFPEFTKIISKEYLSITLADLLSNRARIQPFEDDGSKEWKGIPTIENGILSKFEFAKYALSLNPKIDANKDYIYSNAGFIIAALMMEKASDKSWEELLAMFNNAYGINCSIGFPNQNDPNDTYGHKKKIFKYKSIDPEDEYTFPVDFSAAGNISVSVQDLAILMNQHLLGLIGNSNVLNSETYTKLHYGLNRYSYGWYNGNIGDTDQKFSYHGGSIGTYSSAIMLSADREIGIIILLNADNKKTSKLKETLRTELWEKYGTK